MSTSVTWWDITVRLALAVLAGGLIGLNRGEHGRPFGIRTTILVCLAGCLAMIEANLMLLTIGRTDSSFARIDPLRFPLGILSGIGFIGAGAILKKNDLVVGLTTAATIWFVTTIGLCFGGGQLGLGLAGLGLALGTLVGLKQVEKRLRHLHRAHLRIWLAPDIEEERMLAPLARAGIRVVPTGSEWNRSENCRAYSYKLSWRTIGEDHRRPAAADELAALAGVRQFLWEMEGE